MSNSFFNYAVGTAKLECDDDVYDVRIAFDHEKNQLICARPNDILNPYRFAFKNVNLRDVILEGNGVRWSTPFIRDLTVWKSGGATLSVEHSEIGSIIARDRSYEQIVLSKNGIHVFEITESLPESFEFSGGKAANLDVIIDDQHRVSSTKNRTILYGPNCSEIPLHTLQAIIGISIGLRMQPRFQVKGREFTVYFSQKERTKRAHPIFADSGILENPEIVREGIKAVYLAARNTITGQRDTERLPNLLQLFLSAREVDTLSDIQVLAMFTFIEAIDGSRTLNANSLKELFDMPIEACKQIIKVRNDFLHGKKVMNDAVRDHIDFSSENFVDFQSPYQGEFSYSMNFTNLILTKANRAVADLINFDGDVRDYMSFRAD